MDIYLEIGKKRVIACAVEWPGWCRAGRDEAAALEALAASGVRYAGVIASAGLGFAPPADASDLMVRDRLVGTSGTEFGAPDVPPPSDLPPLDGAGLARLSALLGAYWAAFDAAVASATGRELRSGPRGGGRDLAGVVEHVLGADGAYLARRAWKLPKGGAGLGPTRQAVLDALAAAVDGAEPTAGARGGKIWPARYFARRVAYHVIDHIWEIEDRLR
jgi:hypothetical protein